MKTPSGAARRGSQSQNCKHRGGENNVMNSFPLPNLWKVDGEEINMLQVQIRERSEHMNCLVSGCSLQGTTAAATEKVLPEGDMEEEPAGFDGSPQLLHLEQFNSTTALRNTRKTVTYSLKKATVSLAPPPEVLLSLLTCHCVAWKSKNKTLQRRKPHQTELHVAHRSGSGGMSARCWGPSQ